MGRARSSIMTTVFFKWAPYTSYIGKIGCLRIRHRLYSLFEVIYGTGHYKLGERRWGQMKKTHPTPQDVRQMLDVYSVRRVKTRVTTCFTHEHQSATRPSVSYYQHRLYGITVATGWRAAFGCCYVVPEKWARRPTQGCRLSIVEKLASN